MARVGAELRRQDFVEATIKVIAEHGVANATTRRIATAAGCPLASLHYLFHTKEDLFYAVFETLFTLPQQALENVPAGTTVVETSTGLLRHLIHWFITHPNAAVAQYDLFNWANRNAPEMAAKIYAEAIEAAKQAIERSVGVQLDEASLGVISRLLVQLVDGLVIAWSAHRDDARLRIETETACEALAMLVTSQLTHQAALLRATN
ncbi:MULTISPECIES: TetR/AcrR family transcriptional regulator [Pseudomonas]|uniref:Transcriptional regulator, TetR family n=1 Tax=Pseudomonas panipatensis TaxID=428992 RepID=A0A1G8KQU7_9PSED|nr:MULTISPECIES: TetR/AcrR family transcriptional regulator [Pseudomonas]SDI45835.1 transcriptional regulator, TetR family [Pseudomonas panipatensis]SMP70413.1 transcriptional regulator, TetR family [Pseudomonas panipatensis]